MNKPLAQLQLTGCNYTVGHYLIRDRGPERDGDDFDLSAPYQRQSVWSVDQQRNLIKSLIIGLPVGSVTISKLPYRTADGGAVDKPFRIVDGKQRIEAVRAFADNQLTVPAWWWERDDVLPDMSTREGDYLLCCDLTQRGRLRFEMSQLPANEFAVQREVTRVDGKYVSRLRSPEEMLQAEAELYLLLNFGGVAQTEADAQRARDLT